MRTRLGLWLFATALGCAASEGALDAGSPDATVACSPGLTRCRAECVDLRNDAQHCGACGVSCDASTCERGVCGAPREEAPDGRPVTPPRDVGLDSPPSGSCAPRQSRCTPDGCVDTSTDPRHCGACQRPCAVGARCTAGECACEPGRVVCAGRCVDTASDLAACGGCGLTCSFSMLCAEGRCVCPDGRTACGPSCVDTAISTSDCGSCNHACLPGARCMAGSCACPAGTQQCAGRCEDTSRATDHCGVCGHRCSDGARCTAGVCACPEGTTDCDGRCISVRNDTRNCGACGRLCVAGSECVGGECVCAGGRTRCGDACAALFADPSNCGACGRVCPSFPHAFSLCVRGGACDRVCATGWDDCDGDAANGCETDVTASVAQCGRCGSRCEGANAEMACVGSRCVVARCAAGFGDCNGGGRDGCEARLDASTSHCGGCGRSCRPGARCASGACECPAGVASCAGPAEAPAPCSVARDCPAPPYAVATCEGGACGLRCDGFASGLAAGNCDGDARNGCETPLGTFADCGGCGRACARGQSCSAGLCECPAGQVLCDARCVDVARDDAHCGRCGAPCGADEGCAAGTCVANGAPRPVAPLTTALVTSRQPTLRWRLRGGDDGALVELCRDRACATVIAAIAATGDRAAPSADLPRGVVFWRLRGRRAGVAGGAYSPTWEFVVGPRTAPVDTSQAGFADYNGDGRADCAIALPTVRGNRVAIYHGSDRGLPSAPSAMLVDPDGHDDAFDFTLASVDVDGDGFVDLTVGARRGSGEGARLWVYRGGPEGLSRAPSTVLLRSTALSPYDTTQEGVGDVDRDGFGDIAIGASAGLGQFFVHRGSADGLQATPGFVLAGPYDASDAFGSAIVGPGDLDGDGYSDLARIVVSRFTGARSMLLYPGGAFGPPSAPTTAVPRVSGVVPTGDLDGDGYGDLVTTDLTVYHGRPTGVATVIGEMPRATFQYLGRGGDINGDGYSDLILGAPNNERSSVYVFFGRAAGLASGVDQTIDPPGLEHAAYFGLFVSIVGDINGDGYADATVRSVSHLYVFFGSATGLSPGRRCQIRRSKRECVSPQPLLAGFRRPRRSPRPQATGAGSPRPVRSFVEGRRGGRCLANCLILKRFW